MFKVSRLILLTDWQFWLINKIKRNTYQKPTSGTTITYLHSTDWPVWRGSLKFEVRNRRACFEIYSKEDKVTSKETLIHNFSVICFAELKTTSFPRNLLMQSHFPQNLWLDRAHNISHHDSTKILCFTSWSRTTFPGTLFSNIPPKVATPRRVTENV